MPPLSSPLPCPSSANSRPLRRCRARRRWAWPPWSEPHVARLLGDASVEPPGCVIVGHFRIVAAPQACVGQPRLGARVRGLELQPDEEPPNRVPRPGPVTSRTGVGVLLDYASDRRLHLVIGGRP